MLDDGDSNLRQMTLNFKKRKTQRAEPRGMPSSVCRIWMIFYVDIPIPMASCYVVFRRSIITATRILLILVWPIATSVSSSIVVMVKIHFPSLEYSHQLPDVTRGSGFVALVSLRFSWIFCLAFCFEINFFIIAHDSVISIFGEIATPSALILLLSLTV